MSGRGGGREVGGVGGPEGESRAERARRLSEYMDQQAAEDAALKAAKEVAASSATGGGAKDAPGIAPTGRKPAGTVRPGSGLLAGDKLRDDLEKRLAERGAEASAGGAAAAPKVSGLAHEHTEEIHVKAGKLVLEVTDVKVDMGAVAAASGGAKPASGGAKGKGGGGGGKAAAPAGGGAGAVVGGTRTNVYDLEKGKPGNVREAKYQVLRRGDLGPMPIADAPGGGGAPASGGGGGTPGGG